MLTREKSDMALKDYHHLVGSFWKEKGSKSLKEKSAFEPYHCPTYRPYMMSYHSRPCTKYERPVDIPKYKCISPNCDQCEYENLKRKSNSSLENIILKLKKSRHSDKDSPRHYPHEHEPIHERAPKSLYEAQKHLSLRTLVPSNERITRDIPPPPRHEYVKDDKDLYRERYDFDKSRYSSDKHFEYKESDEKSSFVTMLERKDDLHYASTISMISSLSQPLPITPEKPKSDEKRSPRLEEKRSPRIEEKRSPRSEENETTTEERKVSSPPQSTPTTSVTQTIPEPELSADDKDNMDKIAETKCDKCQKRFYRRSQLIRHISNHVVHECHKCNAFFYCVRKFKKHMATHESYPCEFCEEEFYEASAWYHHRAKHTMVECSSCDMIFYNKTALLKHKFTHLQYICPVCRFPFSNLNHWISHRSCHKTFGSTLLTPLFSCRECSTTFPSQDTYMKHACLHRLKKPLDTKRPMISKRDISDLIGVDQTAR